MTLISKLLPASAIISAAMMASTAASAQETVNVEIVAQVESSCAISGNVLGIFDGSNTDFSVGGAGGTDLVNASSYACIGTDNFTLTYTPDNGALVDTSGQSEDELDYTLFVSGTQTGSLFYNSTTDGANSVSAILGIIDAEGTLFYEIDLLPVQGVINAGSFVETGTIEISAN